MGDPSYMSTGKMIDWLPTAAGLCLFLAFLFSIVLTRGASILMYLFGGLSLSLSMAYLITPQNPARWLGTTLCLLSALTVISVALLSAFGLMHL